MTYFTEGDYSVYDTVPCSVAVFRVNENFDLIYSNKIYKEIFGTGKFDEDGFVKLRSEISEANEPVCIDLRYKDVHEIIKSVRAFVVKISEDTAIAVFVDDSEYVNSINKLLVKCSTYAAAIRGTNEIFYEYARENDSMNIYFPISDGRIETKLIQNWFGDIDNNVFIFSEDKDIVSDIRGKVNENMQLDIRMRLRDDANFEWYRITVKPDNDNQGLFVGTARNIQDIHMEEEELKEKALMDPLSKVYNRSAAIERIKVNLQKCAPENKCALIVLDIDNFKRINDTLGHLYGDAVISMVAGLVKNSLDSDDIMGRFGGDEFFAFIEDADRERLEKKLEDIRQSVLKLRINTYDDKDISCSIGVAVGKGGDEYDELFKKADSALYKAKEKGKNRFEYFDGEYAEKTAINYCGAKDENESNVEHSITTVALEIASKSINPENAIINIMRHAGITFNVDYIQIMCFDCLDNRVDLMFQWIAKKDGEYNVFTTRKKSGYYVHSDLMRYSDCFAKYKIFHHTEEFEEGFSQKYKDVFNNLRHVNQVYASNSGGEDSFYAVIFQSLDTKRKWTEAEMKDMLEITKILSVYLKSTYVETEREKMLAKKIDYGPFGTYTIGKFYEESGKIGIGARACDGKMGVLHIDIKDLFGINLTHSPRVGNDILRRLSDAIMNYEQTKAVGCHLAGTDEFFILFYTNLSDEKSVAELVEKDFKEVCRPFENYTNPKVCIKAGLVLFNAGENIGFQIDKAKYAKKGKSPDECKCYIAE